MQKVAIKVNGCSRQFVIEPDRVLLDVLRDDLGLTGAKQSCDRKGQCGACTVIVNGKAVRSCLQKMKNLDGAEVITVEGLGTPDNPHLIQEAYVLSGAIQCGFCTPGMIMATKVLLDRNPNPSDDEIKKALEHNLCRCTGYVKIFDAVRLAGRFIRGETTPAAVRPDPNGPKIGVSHPRPTGMIKACGTAHFGADIRLQDALQLAVTLSTEWHALIKSVDTSAAEKMEGVVGVMTHKDIKGDNRIKILVADQPVLAEDKVCSLGDPIAIVGGPDEGAGRRSRSRRASGVRAAARIQVSERGNGRRRGPDTCRVAQPLLQAATDKGRRGEGARRISPRSGSPF